MNLGQNLGKHTQSTYAGVHKFLALLPMIFLLWLFLLTRVVKIADFPYFIDEMHHVRRAQIVWSFSDLHVSTTPSKFLLYYYLGIFELPHNLPGWIARTPVALFGVIGAASTYSLTRHFFSRQAGQFAVLGLIFFPLMIFHERMALTDSFAASIVIFMLWYTMRWLKEPTKQHTTVLAVAIILMLAAKLLALPLVIMPIAAIVLFSHQRFEFKQPLRTQVETMRQKYMPSLWQLARIVGGVWLAIMVFYVGRGLIDPDNTNPIVDDYIYESEDRTSLLDRNLTHLGEVFEYFWGIPLIVVTGVALVLVFWKRPRLGIYLALGILPLWLGLTIVAARPNSRYLAVVGHLWMVLVGGGVSLALDMITQRIPKNKLYLRSALALLMAGWLVSYGAWFVFTFSTEPLDLKLPQSEVRGYYQNISGYGLVDALYAAEELPPISDKYDIPVVVGVGRVCGYWHYHIPADTQLVIDCAPENFERRGPYLDASLTNYGAYYLMRERTDHLIVWIDEAWLANHAELLTTFERPFDGVPIDIYRVTASTASVE